MRRFVGHKGERLPMSRQPSTDNLPPEEWAGAMGERWLTHLAQFEGMIAPIGEALLRRADYHPGERVIDVGCGGGGTTIEIAGRVGPQGTVLGVDVSPALVAAAERRAGQVPNVRFRCADAATLDLDVPVFDRLFSRFGLMFFSDAPAAFAQLHRLLRAGGRADFSVWAPARGNQWVAKTMEILARYVALPAPTPRAPGPFALDDLDYVRDLLVQGGFGAPEVEVWEGEQPVGGAGSDPQSAATFVFDAMSLGKVLDDSPAEIRARAREDLRELFARHHGPDGVLMSAKAYLISATA